MPPFKWEWDTNLQPRLGFILSQVIDCIYLRLAISIVCYFCTSSLSLWLLIVCLCFHYVYTFSHLLCLCCFWLSVFAFLAPTFEQLFCFYYCCLSLSLWYIIYWLHLHVFLVSYFWSFYLLRSHIFSVYAASDQMSVLFHLLRLNNFSASIIASISFACFYIFSVIYYCWLSVFASIKFVRFCLYYCWLSVFAIRNVCSSPLFQLESTHLSISFFTTFFSFCLTDNKPAWAS